MRAGYNINMKISVIIATMNRPDDLHKVLESVAKQSLLPDEVLVIDQSVDDRTRRLVEEIKAGYSNFSNRLKYFFQEEKSLVKARNRGLSLATGEKISFLDDDSELFPDYYERVQAYFEAHLEVGALSGNTLPKEKFEGLGWSLRQGLMRFFLLSDWSGHMTPSGFGHPIYEKEIDRVISVGLLPGCNMNFRAKCIEGEKFDEWFTGYGFREDVDFCYRISKKTQIRMIPDAKLYHHYSTGNRLDVERLKRMEMRNNYYIFKKHKYRNFFSNLIFCYSLCGIIGIDLLEFLTSWDKLKFEKFRAGVSASFEILRRSPL